MEVVGEIPSLETGTARRKAAQSIASWCDDHDISVPTFYRLRKQDPRLMPDVLVLGGRRLITADASDEWLRRMKSKAA